MNVPTLTCQDERRRRTVRDAGRTGIDYVEVDDRDQRNLCVHLFGPFPEKIDAANVRIEGGRRIRDVQVTSVTTESPSADDAEECLRVTVDKAGDFSFYTLRVVEVSDGRPTDKPLAGFDPRYAQVQFSFKVGCPSDLNCKTEAPCPPPAREEPEISYLAKDYASFRQLMLDRLSLIMPEWQERHVPDIGITLVELLAYVGDYLSYYQDAVGTEAYLDTARQRISVRRHARLVDYQLHEGCNARSWITVGTDQDVTDSSLRLKDVYFTTGGGDAQPEVFEPLVENPEAPLRLHAAHSSILFYTWGDEECCLPRGATTATLKDGWKYEKQPEPKQVPLYEQTARRQQSAEHLASPAPEPHQPERKLHLKKGDILIFEEVIGPKTGEDADADPTRRHVVRLVSVTPGEDPLFTQTIPGFEEELSTPVVEVEWAKEDALPFPVCISARLPAPDCTLVTDISVARGNVILVDHGQTIDPPEDLGQVGVKTIVGQCECEGSAIDLTPLPDLFRPPPLKKAPLTYREALTHGTPPAARLLNQDPRKALPQIALIGFPGLCPEPGDGIDPEDPIWAWHPQRDLLDSRSQDQDFVVEIDNDGHAHLRFGDGELGRMPEACMIFRARYRVGNGPAGNVGADTITVPAFRNTASGLTLKPRNPLPARGGAAPEPMAEAKLFAPRAFLKELQRAITADDYARLAERYPKNKIQRAGASLRWTGSWYAAQVAIDPLGRETANRRQLDEIKGYLHRYRRMGHDLEVQQARSVPLEIELQVCVLPHYLRGHVEAALLGVLSNRALPDGRLGFFHPDNLTFGEGVYLSSLVAAAQAVPGVESVQVTTLQCLGEGDKGEVRNGLLPVGPLEIAQLDNDPSFPEHGTLKLRMGGGR
jgi:hypothetical protein